MTLFKFSFIIFSEEHLTSFNVGGLNYLKEVLEGRCGDLCAELLESEVGNVTKEGLGFGQQGNQKICKDSQCLLLQFLAHTRCPALLLGTLSFRFFKIGESKLDEANLKLLNVLTCLLKHLWDHYQQGDVVEEKLE